MPGEGHLLAMRLAGDLLQRLAADEVVVELHERAVAELVRRQVVILDVVRHEAAADRASGFVARRRQPLAVLLHLVAGVDRGQRRGNPTRLERVAGVGARADLHQAEIAARLQDRLADLVALCVRAPDLEPGAPAMPCRKARTLRPLMSIASMLKNLTSGIGPPLRRSRTCVALGPWIW